MNTYGINRFLNWVSQSRFKTVEYRLRLLKNIFAPYIKYSNYLCSYDHFHGNVMKQNINYVLVISDNAILDGEQLY